MKWFTRNLADAEAMEHPQLGTAYLFGESRPRELFEDYGINVRVVQPGQPTALYHSESAEETLVVLVGAGEGPCIARYGASVAEKTDDPQKAWAEAGWSFEDFRRVKLPWPPA